MVQSLSQSRGGFDFDQVLTDTMGFPLTSEDLLVICFNFVYKSKWVNVDEFLEWIGSDVVVLSATKSQRK